MTKNNSLSDPKVKKNTGQRTLGGLVNTPIKKIMFGVQILSYFLIVGSPAIGGITGNVLNLKTGQTAAVILGIFITGEILFYGSLAFLGKEIVLFLRDKFRSWFRLEKKHNSGNH